ncbi:hypothetical protein GCM10020258_42410 [Sphingomonas yabuuchiae]
MAAHRWTISADPCRRRACRIAYGGEGVAWTFVIGAAIFAGTLYAMAFGAPRWFGAITPIGGTLLIGGWLWLAWSLR